MGYSTLSYSIFHEILFATIVIFLINRNKNVFINLSQQREYLSLFCDVVLYGLRRPLQVFLANRQVLKANVVVNAYTGMALT